MKPSWSPTWDALVRRAIREDRPDLLKKGREIDMVVMSMVLIPESIAGAWAAGAWGDLGYLAEWIRSGVPEDLAKTDPVLFANLTGGLAEIRRLGWDRKLDPVKLHRIEDLLQTTLVNQKAEGHELTAEEVAEVRKRLAREFESVEFVRGTDVLGPRREN